MEREGLSSLLPAWIVQIVLSFSLAPAILLLIHFILKRRNNQRLKKLWRKFTKLFGQNSTHWKRKSFFHWRRESGNPREQFGSLWFDWFRKRNFYISFVNIDVLLCKCSIWHLIIRKLIFKLSGCKKEELCLFERHNFPKNHLQW